MTYVVTKIIKGNPYLYEVRSERDGDRVRQVFVRYLGRAGSTKAEARAAEVGMEEAPKRIAQLPRRKRVATPIVAEPKLITPTTEVTIPEGVRPNLYVADIEGMMPDTARVVKTVRLSDGSNLVLKSDDGDIYGLINNQEVGFATKLSDTETDLSVAMEFRNKGIGTELMRQFREENPTHQLGGLTEGGRAVISKLETPITAGQLSKQHGLNIKISEGAEGGEYTGGTVFVGTDTTPIQAFAANWIDEKAPDFKTSKTYPKNVTSEAHEVAHGLFSKNPEAGHQAISELKALGVPDEVAFESLVDTAGLYLLEPDAITNSKIKGVISNWLAKGKETEVLTPTPEAVAPLVEPKPTKKSWQMTKEEYLTSKAGRGSIEELEQAWHNQVQQAAQRGEDVPKAILQQQEELARKVAIRPAPEAWEMSWQDWAKQRQIPHETTYDQQIAKKTHEGLIKEAIAKGKPVSYQILKDYPESVVPPVEPKEKAITTEQPVEPQVEIEKQKEPWEMTNKEWKSFVAMDMTEDERAKTGKTRVELAGTSWQPSEYHKQTVQQALSEGKPVPPEVLKDYPELKPKPEMPKVFGGGVKETGVPLYTRPKTTEELKALGYKPISLEELVGEAEPKPEPEIVSTPKVAKDYIIKKEPEPFLPTGFKYMVYQSNGTPMYISGATQEEAEGKLKQGHKVASVTVESEAEVKPKPTPAPEAVIAPEVTPILEVPTVNEIKATHVTSNPQPVINALETGKNLGETRGEGLVGDLGASGLYVSQNPQMWIGRATSKWSFLDELNPEQKTKLIDKLVKSVDEQMKYGGIADFEYQNLMRDINYVKEGKLGDNVLVAVANQPFNIPFWKPEYLADVGIRQAKLPIEVSVTAKGKFADITNVKGGITQEFIDKLKSGGYDGMIHRGTWGTPEQSVIWNPKAIEQFGEYKQPLPEAETRIPEVGELEKSIRATTNLSSSKYIVNKIDTWDTTTKQKYLNAYNAGDWDAVYALTEDLTGSAYSRQSNLADLADVVEEQLKPTAEVTKPEQEFIEKYGEPKFYTPETPIKKPTFTQLVTTQYDAGLKANVRNVHIGKVGDKKAWADGFMLEIKPVPEKWRTIKGYKEMAQDLEGKPRDFSNLVPDYSEIGKEVKPLLKLPTTQITKTGETFLSNPDGSAYIMADTKYIEYFMKEYPDATFAVKDVKSPIVVQSKRETVGVIMPLFVDESRYTDILQFAGRGKPKVATELKVETAKPEPKPEVEVTPELVPEILEGYRDLEEAREALTEFADREIIGYTAKGQEITPSMLRQAIEIKTKEPIPIPSTKETAPSSGEPTEVILYHGTKEEYPAGEIATSQRMYGIHLTTERETAQKYGQVRQYQLSPDAKTLNLSDGYELWDFMIKQDILDEDDISNPDLERYVTGGELFQYDISSRTSLADDVAKTAKSLGYDIVTMPDNLGDEVNIAYVVVNPKVLKVSETPKFAPRPLGEEGITMAGKGKEIIPAPKKQSILSGETMLEDSREFSSGETAGWKAAEKLLENNPTPTTDEKLDRLINRAHYAPYASELPKYLKENEEQHRAYGMGFDYGVAQAISQKSAKVSPKPFTQEKSHDYEPSWDYEVDDNPNSEVVRLVNKVTVQLGESFGSGFEVKYVKGLDNELGKFIEGTESYPTVIIDAEKILTEARKLGVPLEVAVRTTITHEFAHALNENISEVEAENFAENYEKRLVTPTPIVETKPTISEIPYSRDLDIRNIESLPRGTGAKYLVALKGQGDELIAKQWARVRPASLKPDEVLVSMTTPVAEKAETISTPVIKPEVKERVNRYSELRERIRPIQKAYGYSSGSGLSKQFIAEYLDPLRDTQGKIDRDLWNAAFKRFHNEKIPTLKLEDYLVVGGANFPASPYPDYRFRSTKFREWEGMLKGERSGSFWSGEPRQYIGDIRQYPDDVLLVTKANDTGDLRYVAHREDNGKVMLDNIIAVYRGNPQTNTIERIYTKPDVDLSELEGERN